MWTETCDNLLYTARHARGGQMYLAWQFLSCCATALCFVRITYSIHASDSLSFLDSNALWGVPQVVVHNPSPLDFCSCLLPSWCLFLPMPLFGQVQRCRDESHYLSLRRTRRAILDIGHSSLSQWHVFQNQNRIDRAGAPKLLLLAKKSYTLSSLYLSLL